MLLLLLEGNPELCREHLLPVLSDYSRPQHDGLASIMLVCAIASASFPRHGFSVPSLGAPDPGAADTDPQTAFVQDLVRDFTMPVQLTAQPSSASIQAH